MKKNVFNISKIILSCLTIPLWFVKMFTGVGLLLDPNTNKPVEVVFYHSMYENISDMLHPVFAYMAIIIAVFAVVCNALAIFIPNNKAVKIISNVLFFATIAIFLILLICASAVGRGY